MDLSESYLGEQEFAPVQLPQTSVDKFELEQDNEAAGNKRPSSIQSLPSTSTTANFDVLDIPEMPVDPNEPTYCLCKRVSYGEMIGCDNEECPVEWFHFECVGLKESVKGKWYCPLCRGKVKPTTG